MALLPSTLPRTRLVQLATAAYGVSFRNAPSKTIPCMRICKSASDAISRAILTMSQKWTRYFFSRMRWRTFAGR